MYLDAHEFRIQLTDSAHLPGAYVQLRSAWLHEAGAREAFRRSLRVVESIIGTGVGDAAAARVDLYADFADWVLRREHLADVVTHAKLTVHARAGTDELETLMVGKHPLAVRLYRKDIELRQRGGFAPLFWDGWTGPVLRVEVQAGSETLRLLGIRSVDEALSCVGDLWRHATTFVELREPAGADRAAWPLRADWQLVREIGFESFPRCGLVPYRVVQGQRDRVTAALLGWLASYGAFDDLTEPRACVEAVLREFPTLVRGEGRTFAEEVRRRRARLPRSVRRGPTGGESPLGQSGAGRKGDADPQATEEVDGHA